MYFSVVWHDALLAVLHTHTPERGHNGLGAVAHQVGERCAEMAGGFLQVVVRDLDEHVVHLVCACNHTEESSFKILRKVFDWSVIYI